jgi:hypothetical protein
MKFKDNFLWASFSWIKNDLVSIYPSVENSPNNTLRPKWIDKLNMLGMQFHGSEDWEYVRRQSHMNTSEINWPY